MLRVRSCCSWTRHSTISSRDLEQALDDVLAERSRRAQVAASQILDLLGYMFKVELVAERRQAAQQRRWLLRSGVEIFLVERFSRGHLLNLVHSGFGGKADERMWYKYR